MSFSALQRRAFLVALATMVGVAAVILCYWQAVSKGLVPSPVQPLVHRPPSASVSTAAAAGGGARAEIVTVGAIELAPSPPRAPEFQTMAQPSVAQERVNLPSLAPVAAPPHVERAVQRMAASPNSTSTNQLLHPTVPNHVASNQPELKSEARKEASPGSRASAADEQQAARWLSNKNERPVVRVHYETAEILRMAELGRGVIVATSYDKADARELYLQSKAGVSPLFAPYTHSIADRFSSYSLTLDSSPALVHLTTAFPVYFPGATVTLAFLPDHALATEMFAQIAQASRSATGEAHRSHRTVYEGQLTLAGNEPRFDLLEIRSGTKRVLVSASGSNRE